MFFSSLSFDVPEIIQTCSGRGRPGPSSSAPSIPPNGRTAEEEKRPFLLLLAGQEEKSLARLLPPSLSIANPTGILLARPPDRSRGSERVLAAPRADRMSSAGRERPVRPEPSPGPAGREAEPRRGRTRKRIGSDGLWPTLVVVWRRNVGCLDFVR